MRHANVKYKVPVIGAFEGKCGDETDAPKAKITIPCQPRSRLAFWSDVGSH
jgi:hypothetical protein